MPTTARRIRTPLLVCLAVAIAARAGAQTVTLKPLTPAEVQSVGATLDKALLPDGAANLRVVSGQSFHVRIAGRTDVTLLPVQFSFSEPGLVVGIPRVLQACGLYLVEGSGKTHFDKIAEGDGDGLIQCSGVDGVGLASGSGPHPRMILLFNVHTVHRSWSDPYLVSWSDDDRRYVTEVLSAPSGTASTAKLTIAQVRGWVALQK